MDFKIAVLAGDGIGPEISVQGVEVMSAVCEKFGHKVSYEYAICGADAIDKVGDPFPEKTYQVCKEADAVLFSAVGDPKFDNDPTAKVRPEQGLLAMRKKLGLFANIRPVQTFKCLIHKSPLRAELVENALFATLDTAVRRARAKDGRQYAYVDTVGFVRRLPTQLIEAFKSTLEEVSEADLIVHVVDGSHPDPFSQIDAVDDVLSDIDGVETIPTIIVFNKADRMDEATRERIEALMPEAYIVSAFSGEGVDELRMQVESMLPTPNVHVEALLPYTAGSLVSRVREYGKVINVEYRDDGMMLEAEVDDHLAAQIVEQSIG